MSRPAQSSGLRVKGLGLREFPHLRVDDEACAAVRTHEHCANAQPTSSIGLQFVKNPNNSIMFVVKFSSLRVRPSGSGFRVLRVVQEFLVSAVYCGYAPGGFKGFEI